MQEHLKNSSIEIHPTAIIEPGATLASGVKIGPYCLVGKNVEIGEGTILKSHVVIEGHVKIGQNNLFHQFCSIGAAPQDLSYKGEETKVVIGDNNQIREYVSIHRGTLKQDGITILGSNCFLMAYVHLAHDVVLGNKVVLVNNVNLAGHVRIDDGVTIGGNTSVGQFITIGRGAYIGGASGIDKDVPPYTTAYGNRVHLKGVNIIGMRRRGHDRKTISEFIDFYKSIEASSLAPRTFIERADLMSEYQENEIIREVAEFIRKSEIGIAQFDS